MWSRSSTGWVSRGPVASVWTGWWKGWWWHVLLCWGSYLYFRKRPMCGICAKGELASKLRLFMANFAITTGGMWCSDSCQMSSCMATDPGFVVSFTDRNLGQIWLAIVDGSREGKDEKRPCHRFAMADQLWFTDHPKRCPVSLVRPSLTFYSAFCNRVCRVWFSYTVNPGTAVDLVPIEVITRIASIFALDRFSRYIPSNFVLDAWSKILIQFYVLSCLTSLSKYESCVERHLILFTTIGMIMVLSSAIGEFHRSSLFQHRCLTWNKVKFPEVWAHIYFTIPPVIIVIGSLVFLTLRILGVGTNMMGTFCCVCSWVAGLCCIHNNTPTKVTTTSTSTIGVPTNNTGSIEMVRPPPYSKIVSLPLIVVFCNLWLMKYVSRIFWRLHCHDKMFLSLNFILNVVRLRVS